MNICLTKPELERFIAEEIKAGRFASEAEVVEAGLVRLMLDPEPPDLDAETLAAIDRAEAEFDRGEGRPFKDFVAEFRAQHLSQRGD